MAIQPIRNSKFSSADLRKFFLPIVYEITSSENSFWFHERVDVQDVPNYYDIIKDPIALCDIKQKLDNGEYDDPWTVIDDFLLMFNNCFHFNCHKSEVYKAGESLCNIFKISADKAMKSLGYCCGTRYFYSRKSMFCATERSCNIKFDSCYFLAAIDDKEYVVCDKCHLRADVFVVMSDQQKIPKTEFIEHKHNVIKPEEYLTCQYCTRKWHAICALQSPNSIFTCPTCIEENQLSPPVEQNNIIEPIERSDLSSVIERSVDSMLKNYATENLEFNIEEMSPIEIRDFLSDSHQFNIKENMNNYCHLNRSRLFSSDSDDSKSVSPIVDEDLKQSLPAIQQTVKYNARAIYAFQKIDGKQVVFFAIHAQEYPPDTPGKNSGCVYLTYVDSVSYMQPNFLRTKIYKEILQSYMRYLQENSYIQMHLWICPAEVGNDYLFYLHPVTQKMPKKERLCKWYNDIFDLCKINGIVDRIVNIYDYYFIENPIKSLDEIKCFDGDFWPNNIEEIIKKVEREIKRDAYNLNDSEHEDDASIVSGESNKSKNTNTTVMCTRKRKRNRVINNGIGKRQKFNYSEIMKFILKIFHQNLQEWKNDFLVVYFKSIELPRTKDSIAQIGYSTGNLETRDNLLAFFRDNNLEFNSLRRAKYATMVFLNEIKVELAKPKFTCDVCKTQNMTERYNCPTCIDYDMCGRCYNDEKYKEHEHPLIKVGLNVVSASNVNSVNDCTSCVSASTDETKELTNDTNSDDKSSKNTDVNIEYRQNLMTSRKLSEKCQAAVDLLEHTYSCNNSKCTEICMKLKRMLIHFQSCDKRSFYAKKTNTQCSYCFGIMSLFFKHSQKCMKEDCEIPYCQYSGLVLSEEFLLGKQFTKNTRHLCMKDSLNVLIQIKNYINKLKNKNKDGLFLKIMEKNVHLEPAYKQLLDIKRKAQKINEMKALEAHQQNLRNNAINNNETSSNGSNFKTPGSSISGDSSVYNNQENLIRPSIHINTSVAPSKVVNLPHFLQNAKQYTLIQNNNNNNSNNFPCKKPFVQQKLDFTKRKEYDPNNPTIENHQSNHQIFIQNNNQNKIVEYDPNCPTIDKSIGKSIVSIIPINDIKNMNLKSSNYKMGYNQPSNITNISINNNNKYPAMYYNNNGQNNNSQHLPINRNQVIYHSAQQNSTNNNNNTNLYYHHLVSQNNANKVSVNYQFPDSTANVSNRLNIKSTTVNTSNPQIFQVQNPQRHDINNRVTLNTNNKPVVRQVSLSTILNTKEGNISRTNLPNNKTIVTKNITAKSISFVTQNENIQRYNN